jgi:hypothetical protein
MHAIARLFAAGLCAAAAASAVQAQTRSVQPRANVIPSASARAAQAAPQPSGLRPVFPAGVSSGSGAVVSTDRVAASTATAPAVTDTIATTTGAALVTPAELPSIDNPTNANAAAAAATTVLGAGATVRGPGQTTGGAGGCSATDVARSFYFADANHDGELSRAEAGRLSIRSMTFEEMDRNFDGIISRFEYDDSVR